MEEKKVPLYEMDVRITTEILYDYLLKHIYSGVQGILATCIGGLLVLYFLSSGKIIYLIFGIIVILYIPVSLYISAKRQMLLTPAFKEPLHYCFFEDGIEVSQGDIVEMQQWENMKKAISTGKSIIIYTSKVNAAIFPRKDMKEHTVDVIEIICTHMEPKKVRIKQ